MVGTGVGDAALRLAAANGHHDVVAVLLAAGADPDGADALGFRPLHQAAAHDHPACVALLLAAGADPNAAAAHGGSALHLAAAYGHPAIVAQLLAGGGDPNALDRYEASPLHRAAALRRAAGAAHAQVVAAMLVALGDPTGSMPKADLLAVGDIDERLAGCAAGLLAAAGVGGEGLASTDSEIEAPLVAAFAAAERPDGWRVWVGRPPGVEEEGRHAACVAALLAAGADANVADYCGHSPLGLAAEAGSATLVTRLLDAGADPDGVERKGAPPLHGAAEAGSVDVIEALVAAGADVRRKDLSSGAQALHCAAYAGSAAAAAALLAAGADPNAKDDTHDTPLHSAAGYGSADVVATLLAAGADPTAIGRRSHRPHQVAAWAGHAAIAAVLEAAAVARQGADAASPDAPAVAATDEPADAAQPADGAGGLLWPDAPRPAAGSGGGAGARLHRIGSAGRRREVVAALLIRRGRVLLARRAAGKRIAPGKWHLPGGHVESGESDAAALRREIQEELGVDVTVRDTVYAFDYLWDDEPASGNAHLVTLDVPNADLRWDPRDIAACAWVEEDRLSDYLAADDHNLEAAKRGFEWLRVALDRAVADGKPQRVAALLAAGADPNGPAGRQWRPLHSAIQAGSWKTARALLAGGADPNAVEERGLAPLHLLCLTCYGDHSWLERKGFPPMGPEEEAAYGEMAAALLAAGANRDGVDVAGDRPLDLAMVWELDSIAAVLRVAGARRRGDAGRDGNPTPP
jgi:ankyrin repeat protein